MRARVGDGEADRHDVEERRVGEARAGPAKIVADVVCRGLLYSASTLRQDAAVERTNVATTGNAASTFSPVAER